MRWWCGHVGWRVRWWPKFLSISVQQPARYRLLPLPLRPTFKSMMRSLLSSISSFFFPMLLEIFVSRNGVKTVLSGTRSTTWTRWVQPDVSSGEKRLSTISRNSNKLHVLLTFRYFQCPLVATNFRLHQDGSIDKFPARMLSTLCPTTPTRRFKPFGVLSINA